MNIQIICIGKLKEKYWTEAIDEYTKRLSRFCTLQITELKESRLPDKASAAEEQLVKQEEFRIVRIGNAIRVSKKSFDEWLESLEL